MKEKNCQKSRATLTTQSLPQERSFIGSRSNNQTYQETLTKETFRFHSATSSCIVDLREL